MFLSHAEDERKVLSFFEKQIKPQELSKLSELGGFCDPNNFPVSRFLDPLREKHYPQKDFADFRWAINESEIAHLKQLSQVLQFYLSSLYIYCNKIEPGGLDIEGDCYFLTIQSELSTGISQSSEYFLMFIEWLYDHVEEGEGYEDYYLLLGWLLFRRLRQDGSREIFSKVFDALKNKHYPREVLETLTVSENGINEWLTLNRQIPGLHGYTPEDFEPIIRGFD